MTTPFLAQDISSDEGYAKALPNGDCEAYPDPLSGGDPWTIGYGSTGPDVVPGTVWSQAQAQARRDAYIETCEKQLDSHISWWRDLNDERQDVLVNMAYNMGWGGLSGFQHALAALERHDYDTAADEFEDSLWAKQVPNRASRLIEQIRTGVRA